MVNNNAIDDTVSLLINRSGMLEEYIWHHSILKQGNRGDKQKRPNNYTNHSDPVENAKATNLGLNKPNDGYWIKDDINRSINNYPESPVIMFFDAIAPTYRLSSQILMQ